MDNPDELTPFEEAFPEAHSVQDRLAQVREQVLYDEVDITEAESILLAIKQPFSRNHPLGGAGL